MSTLTAEELERRCENICKAGDEYNCEFGPMYELLDLKDKAIASLEAKVAEQEIALEGRRVVVDELWKEKRKQAQRIADLEAALDDAGDFVISAPWSSGRDTLLTTVDSLLATTETP